MGLSIFLSLPHGASLSLLLMEMELWWGEEAHHGRAVYTVHGACHVLCDMLTFTVALFHGGFPHGSICGQNICYYS